MKHVSVSGVEHNPDFADQALEARDRLCRLLQKLDEIVMPDVRQGDPATADRVRSILKARRMRDQFFERELFADPAWDILLELYLADLMQYRMSIGSLCIGAAVPATTALRWIKLLERKGVIMRNADPGDGRRVFVSLSDRSHASMDALLRAIPATEQLF